jgi:uric acid transporter
MSAPETTPSPPSRSACTQSTRCSPKLATYSFQHVVAFYAGAVLVPIVIAGAIDLSQDQLVKLITDLFTCGIASIIQGVGFWKIGVRLPLLQVVTFAGCRPSLRSDWHTAAVRPACCTSTAR